MKHKNCGGHFEQYIIREHGFCFLRCDKCGYHLGGEETTDTIKKLMRIKVWPTIRRA